MACSLAAKQSLKLQDISYKINAKLPLDLIYICHTQVKTDMTSHVNMEITCQQQTPTSKSFRQISEVNCPHFQ